MEDKRGLIGWIILGVVFVILLALIIAGTYFYNFHVFETVRLCLGEGNDTGFACVDVQECFDKGEELKAEYDLSDLPDFVVERIESLKDDAVYCDGTCKIRNVRGIDLESQELEMLESCDVGEDEILIEIGGKEGLEIMSYLKDRGV